MKHALAVFFITLIAYVLTASGHLYTPDGEIMYRTTRSIAEEGDLTIEPLEGFATRSNERGEEYSQYGVGQPILAVPFYLAGKALIDSFSLQTWTRLYGLPDPAPGTTAMPEEIFDVATRFGVSWFNIAVGALTAPLLCLLLIRLTGHAPASALAAILYALGSLAWAHSRPFYSESLAVFFMLLAWWALAKAAGPHATAHFPDPALRVHISDYADTGGPRRSAAGLILWCLVAGAATGYAFLVRMDSVLMYPGTAFLLLGPIRRAAASAGRTAAAWLAFCLPALACLAVFLTLNVLHFGGPFEVGYSDQPEGVQFSTPVLAGLYGFLFSAGKGLFFFSPALILGLFGWPELLRRDRWLFAALLVVILVPLLVMSKWVNWAGGWTWGPRHIVMIHPFLIVPAAFWLAASWTKPRRIPALILLVVGIGVNLLGLSQNFMEFHQRYYRDPTTFTYRVRYDSYDAAYWSEFYALLQKLPTDAQTQPVPLSAMPAPIYHSIYFPQASVWDGYPRLFRETRSIDNLWFRLLRAEYDKPLPGVDPPPAATDAATPTSPDPGAPAP